MKRPDKPTIVNQSEYIDYLEKYFNAIPKLKRQMLLMADKLADEIESVSNGNLKGLTILNSDEKLFERLNTLVKTKEWSDLAIMTEETETKTVTKRKTNIQDFIAKPK